MIEFNYPVQREPWWVPYERPQLASDMADSSGSTYTDADTDPYEIDDQKITPAAVLIALAIGLVFGFILWAAS